MTQRVGGWLAAAVALALGGCIVVPVGTGGRVVVTYEDEGPLLSSGPAVAAFAAALAPRLREVIDELAARRRALPPPASPRHAPAARAAIADAEAEVQALLTDPGIAEGLAAGVEELAPLRDYVAEAARAALTELGRQQAALAPRRRPVPALDRYAALDLRPAQQPADGGSALDDFIGALSRLLARTEAGDLQTTFCAVSEPPGGVFDVFPASAVDRGKQADAVEALVLWRGTYSYRVTMGNLVENGSNLDLMLPELLTLACNVEGPAIACRERYGLAPGCGP